MTDIDTKKLRQYRYLFIKKIVMKNLKFLITIFILVFTLNGCSKYGHNLLINTEKQIIRSFR